METLLVRSYCSVSMCVAQIMVASICVCNYFVIFFILIEASLIFSTPTTNNKKAATPLKEFFTKKIRGAYKMQFIEEQMSVEWHSGLECIHSSETYCS